jgi:hypothetical protein
MDVLLQSIKNIENDERKCIDTIKLIKKKYKNINYKKVDIDNILEYIELIELKNDYDNDYDFISQILIIKKSV